ncbi:MAG: bifunctional 4-hydroxy-2-oxoglutarate aldolase/2-dehydro-3-deoxy-phosphogluconate aldolase [Chloroflexi bacterium]|nr:bifunctional 4-hydroxy-2-oxoglutarate aldolase/2-dehydro-3-deoxy-phosphogluconate aldolase [Chloroflexota bacterium]
MSADELRRGPVADEIRRHRLVVVLRRVEPRSALLSLAAELADAGGRIFEITLDGRSAADDLAALRSDLAARDDGPHLVGAGTVMTATQVDAALDAGADFGVAPILDAGVLRTAIDAGLPFIPGALTPTEIAGAWSAGATFVKLFPASAVGPSAIRELRGPLPEIELIPTGGIDRSNAASFLDAGAAAVGIGGAITRADPGHRRELVRAIANL